MSVILEHFRKDKEFRALMEEVLKHRPVVPAFTIMDTKDEQEQVVERIKYYTALRNGFDLLHSVLTGKIHKE